MRKISIFGRMIPVTILIAILMSGVGLAALLTYYGQIITTANVQQSIIVDGYNWNMPINQLIPESAPGGETFCWLHKIKNQASIDIPIKFTTTPAIEGITTTMYNVPATTTLILENKDASWKAIVDTTIATLTFDTVSPTFKGTLTTSGLGSEYYALIYKPDTADRFTTWNGVGGIVIATWQGNAVGLAIDKDLGMNLPNIGDWNINPSPDYCLNHNTFDSYVHCKGAKLWIVPTSDLTGSVSLPLISWNNHANWLYETDLITYSDCSFESGPEFAVDMVKGDLITSLGTKTKTTTPVLVCYGFDKLIAPGAYTITTNVVPAP